MLLVGRQEGIRPVKVWSDKVLAWLSWQGANDLHMVQLMPAPPRHLLLQQNPEWFILLVPAYPGCHGKKAVKRFCMCVLLGYIAVTA